MWTKSLYQFSEIVRLRCCPFYLIMRWSRSLARSFVMSRFRNFDSMSGKFCVCKLIASTYAGQIGAVYTQIITKPVSSSSKLSIVYFTVKSLRFFFAGLMTELRLRVRPFNGQLATLLFLLRGSHSQHAQAAEEVLLIRLSRTQRPLSLRPLNFKFYSKPFPL